MSETEMLRPDSQGKVRDIYDLGDKLLIVASDRISAFDYILPSEIPFKGEVLTRISKFWFEKFADLVPNHMLSTSIADLPEQFQPYADYLAGRFMLVKKAKPIMVECIVRGYLTGSGKKTYDQDGTVCGIKLPEGLTEASKLAEPIFTTTRTFPMSSSSSARVPRLPPSCATCPSRFTPPPLSMLPPVASSSPTPSSSSASLTARSRSSTSASRPTPAASGRPRATRRARSRTASTSSMSATG